MPLDDHSATALRFAPSADALRGAIEVLTGLGGEGGGAVDARVRQAALEAYERRRARRTAMPPNWRHDYGNLDFDGFTWRSGRMRVETAPVSAPRRTQDQGEPDADTPALALENAGGIVHVGSTYLEPRERVGDPRVTLAALADAKRAAPQVVRAIHERIVAPNADQFTALATAFQNCGVFVDVPPGVVVEAPLQLVWLARPGEAAAVFAHTVVRVGAGARATIVERHAGESEAFVCGIVEIELGDGAHLDYAVIQEADEASRILVRRGARCAAGATIGWHVADLGATLVRSVIDAKLDDTGARAEIDAFSFANGFKHVDLALDVDHRWAKTTSRAIVRSAASERGQGRMSGVVHVAHDAQGAHAEMRSDGLILSRDAYLGATPRLEILANDVSVANAATTGSLDADALFYVKTRGIRPRDAERMIALAFFEAAITGFPTEALRDEVRTALDRELDRIPEAFTT